MKDFKCGVYFDTRRAKKNGQYPIFLKIYREQKYIYFDTGLSADRNMFDGERFLGNSAEAVQCNKELRTLYDSFRLWCLDFDDRDMPNATVKMFADKFLEGKVHKHGLSDCASMSLRECWNEYVTNCVHTQGTEDVYDKNWKYIAEFDKTIELRDVNAMWLRSFDNWMIKRGLKINSRGQVMRNIRTIINYAIACEYTQHYPFKQFKIKVEETPMRALTKEELITLRDTPCYSEYQSWARDMFMLTFYLMGINAIDLAGLKKIKNGRIQYRRGKTHQLYDIAVPPEALEIINRYRGKEYLLDWHERHDNYRIVATYVNKFLQQIGMNIKKGSKYSEGEPLFPDLTLYWARYSAASLMAELDIPMETISRCLGHSSGLRVTQIYVKFNQKKIDEAQRKMIDALK